MEEPMGVKELERGAVIRTWKLSGNCRQGLPDKCFDLSEGAKPLYTHGPRALNSLASLAFHLLISGQCLTLLKANQKAEDKGAS